MTLGTPGEIAARGRVGRALGLVGEVGLDLGIPDVYELEGGFKVCVRIRPVLAAFWGVVSLMVRASR